jgi:hypothetical protein
MGSYSVIAVLGFLIVAAIIMGQITGRNNESYENSYGYFKYTSAKEIAHASIQVALKKIDTLAVVTDAEFPVTGTLSGGSFRVDGVVLAGDTLRLTARGTFQDSTYVVTARLTRGGSMVPGGVRRLTIGFHTPQLDFNSGSNDTIDGRDHDLAGWVIPGAPDSAPALTVMAKSDSSTMDSGNKGPAITNDQYIIGTPKVKVDSTVPDPNTFGPQYKSVANYIYYNNSAGTQNNPKSFSLPGGNFGDSAHPIVMYCEGYGTSYFSLSGQTHGWGVLAVHGKLKFTGNGSWVGIVLVFGNSTLDFDAGNGNGNIIGAVLYGGLPGSPFSSGNAFIKHSSRAIEMAMNVAKPSQYTIIDWYE